MLAPDPRPSLSASTLYRVTVEGRRYTGTPEGVARALYQRNAPLDLARPDTFEAYVRAVVGRVRHLHPEAPPVPAAPTAAELGRVLLSALSGARLAHVEPWSSRALN